MYEIIDGLLSGKTLRLIDHKNLRKYLYTDILTSKYI